MVSLKKPSLGNKILYEIAIGIVAVILLLGVLNTVTHTEKVLYFSTDQLTGNETVRIYYYNLTTGENSRCEVYMLSDIATKYGGYWYISIDIQPNEYFSVLMISTNKTWNDAIEHGVNYYSAEIQLIGDIPTDKQGDFWYGFNAFGYWLSDMILPVISHYEDYLRLSNNSTTTAKVNGPIDVGQLVTQDLTKHFSNKNITIFLEPYNIKLTNINGIKLKAELYTTSEKPILKMFTEPAYGIIAGLWSTLVAVYHRIRPYALSFFGGFSISALFTGLIGDPVTALVITAAVVAVFFFALTRPAPRRRHD